METKPQFVEKIHGRVIEVRSKEKMLTPISWLPDELVLTIFSFLDVEMIAIVSRVSQSFHQICEKPLLWRFYVKKYCISNSCTGLFKTFGKLALEESSDYWKTVYKSIRAWKGLKLIPISIGSPDTSSIYDTEFIFNPATNEAVHNLHLISRNRFISITNSTVFLYSHKDGKLSEETLHTVSLTSSYSNLGYYVTQNPRYISRCKHRIALTCKGSVKVYNTDKSDILESSFEAGEATMLHLCDSKMFVGGKNKKVGMFNYDGVKLWEFNVNNNFVPTCVDRLGNVLVSGSASEIKVDRKDHDGEIKLWDVVQSKAICKLWPSDGAKLGQVIYTKLDNQSLVTATTDCVINYWDLRSKKSCGQFVFEKSKLPKYTLDEFRNLLKVSVKGNNCITVSQSGLKVFDWRKDSSIWQEPSTHFFKVVENNLFFSSRGYIYHTSLNAPNNSTTITYLTNKKPQVPWTNQVINAFDVNGSRVVANADMCENFRTRTNYYRAWKVTL